MSSSRHTAACQSLAADVYVSRQAQEVPTRHSTGEAKLVSTNESWPKACSYWKGKKEPAANVRIVRRNLLGTPGCVLGTASHNLLWITNLLIVHQFSFWWNFYSLNYPGCETWFFFQNQTEQEREGKHQPQAQKSGCSPRRCWGQAQILAPKKQ